MSKKNFTDQLNQAQAEWFISPETKAKVDGTPAPEPEPADQKADHETKSKRVQVLLKPSIFEALKTKAVEERTSVNDLINTLLFNSLKEH